ncbi:hypothetical protein [Micromonospora thermarum]|uniref:Secreted protein n=1 Tax=Micromonospora thermarum TaxID=2720024 RepID=A0ABX0Z1J3_9ACTN|nr:hypothetical protein [Micromonospora thermarum]NJP30869.1 hypothetical protein [Micromonospora thermarum]
MTSILRRKAATIAFVVLALTLAGGGMAVAKPVAQPPAEAAQSLRQPRSNVQPPVSGAERAAAKAALAKGAAGTLAVGALYAAVVEQNPVTGVWQVTRSSHPGTTVTQVGVGWFSVNFPVNVSTGVYTATIGTTRNLYVPPSGEIAVAPRRDLANSVFVATRESDGDNRSLPFHLVVHQIV